MAEEVRSSNTFLLVNKSVSSQDEPDDFTRTNKSAIIKIRHVRWEQSSPEMELKLQVYTSFSNVYTGLPVVLQFADVKNQEYTLCCSKDKRSVHSLKDYRLPDILEDLDHEALFFLKMIEGQYSVYGLESARWRNSYLSFSCPAFPREPSLLEKTGEVNEDLYFHLGGRG